MFRITFSKYLIGPIAVALFAITVLVGVAPVHATECPSLEPGNTFRVEGHDMIYILNEEMERVYFPPNNLNGAYISTVFATWYESDSEVVDILVECAEAYPASGSGVNFRPGSRLVKSEISSLVYAVGTGNVRHRILNEETAEALYGADWTSLVYVIDSAFWQNYTDGPDVEGLHGGMLVTTDSIQDTYYMYNGMLHKVIGQMPSFLSNDIRTVDQSLFNVVEISDTDVTPEFILADPTQMLALEVPAATGIVYEDAENGNTLGWTVTDATPAGANILNVYEDAEHGNVIELVGTKTKNSFTLTLEDGSLWNNTTQTQISWDMNFFSRYYVYVQVQTTDGPRLVVYTSKPTQSYGGYIYVADAPVYKDGQWHTMERDLQADVHAQFPGTDIISVESFSVRGHGKVDNIVLSDNLDIQGFYEIAGIVTTVDGNPIAEATVVLSGDASQTVFTDETGKYVITNVEAGSYKVSVSAEGFVFDPSSYTFDLGQSQGNPVIDFASGQQVLEQVYEDAENEDTLGWTISDNTPVGATIENVMDVQKQSRVIQLTGTKIKNSFTLTNEDGSLWHNTDYAHIGWDMNFSSKYYMYVKVETTDGPKLVVYTSHPSASYGGYIYVPDAPAYTDGQWHTVERNIQADIHAQYPDIDLLSVESLSVRGSGMMDNVRLFSDEAVVFQAELHVSSGPLPVVTTVSAGEKDVLAETFLLSAVESNTSINVDMLTIQDGIGSDWSGIRNFVLLQDGVILATVNDTSYSDDGHVSFIFQEPIFIEAGESVLLELYIDTFVTTGGTTTFGVTPLVNAEPAMNEENIEVSVLYDGVGAHAISIVPNAATISIGLVEGEHGTPATTQVVAPGTQAYTVFAFSITPAYEGVDLKSLSVYVAGQSFRQSDLQQLKLYSSLDGFIDPIAIAPSVGECFGSQSVMCEIHFDGLSLIHIEQDSTITLRLVADVSGPGIVNVGDQFVFGIFNPSTDIELFGTQSGSKITNIFGTAVGNAYTHIASQDVVVSAVSPSSPIVVGTSAGTVIGAYKLTNSGLSDVTITNAGFTNHGAVTSSMIYNVYASADGGSSVDMSTELGTALSASALEAFVTTLNIAGGSHRYITIRTAHLADHLDTHVLSVTELGTFRFSVDEADLGYSANPYMDFDLGDVVDDLYVNGTPSTEVVIHRAS